MDTLKELFVIKFLGVFLGFPGSWKDFVQQKTCSYEQVPGQKNV